MLGDAMWRAEDEALLQRLTDELVVERLFRYHVANAGRGDVKLHPRAAGMITLVRKTVGGEDAVAAALDGDVAKLARFLDAGPMSQKPPALLHHVALYFGKVATAMESTAPDAAANAWMRALAAWLALGEERLYLASLERAVLGETTTKGPKAGLSPERVPLEVMGELGKRAEKTSRDLLPQGRAALLALAWLPDAAKLAGVSEPAARRARGEAERLRNAALEAALAVIGEALDDANVRGDLSTRARALLLRAVDVWTWSERDESVEQFVVDRLGTIGWELYRARRWGELRALLEPFRPLIENLAVRIERDPTKIAYAAPCAQMYVFLSDVDTGEGRRAMHAERAVKVCPTHRNGRLILASALCDQAMASMRTMVLFARRDELERIEALVARAEKLYPQSSDLPEAKAMLERVRKGRIAF